jgi:succinate dehydrogenase / fumarate reductase membrane anchor subunit
MVKHLKVSQLLALTKSGLKDWLLQRVSAVIIALYFCFLVGFFWTHHPLMAGDWLGLFSNASVKVVSLFVLLMMLVHAWIGIWTVLTDYIHCAGLRAGVLFVVFAVFFACFMSGILILWS